MARKKSVFEEEAQRRSYLPSVGQYDSTNEPLYIRGTNPNTNQFASKTERFVFRPKNVPGPGEYEAKSQFDPQAPIMPSIKPAKIAPQQITEPSIPYQNQPKLSNELTQNQRNRWVLETAGYEQLTNPSCQDYDPYYVPDLPKDVQVVVPVGGGGSSLARTMKPSPWAKAPNRFDLDPKTKQVRASVGLYQLGNTQYDTLRYSKQSNCFASNQDRFTPHVTTTGPRIGPGTYSNEGHGTIQQTNNKLKQQTELREEMQRRLGEADEIVQQLHPLSSSQPVKGTQSDGRNSLNDLERAQINNPAVGQYNIAEYDQIKPPDVNQLSVDAQMKIALLSTFSVEKWHQQGASIPSKVQSDEVLPERILPEKPRKRGQLEMQTDRDIAKSLYPQIMDEETAAVGQYNLDRSFKKLTAPKKLNQLQSAPFHKGNELRYMDVLVNDKKAQEHEVMLAEKQKREIDAEQRSVGGVNTQLDYTKAKTASYVNNVVFGSTLERETGGENGLLGGKDPAVPGPCDYKIPGYEGRQITINYKERVMAGQPSPDVLPEVLRQDIGPGAERALNIIAERRQADKKVGPGLYGGDTVRRVEGLKRSFNIKAQDKKL